MIKIIENLIQFGEVLEIFSDGTAKVFFPALNKESGKLQILYSNTFKDKEYFQFDKNEVVLCLLIPQTEFTEGVILGAVYNEKDKVPPFATSSKIKGIQFEDGTKIYYDKKQSILNIECVNEVILNCKKLNITTESEVNINTKKMNIKAEVSNFNHNIKCKDLETSKGSHNSHKHTTTVAGEPTSETL